VLVAEDMHMLRRALVAVIEMEEDIEVVAEMSCGDGILSAALKFRPDVAVLDIDLPGMDGLTAAALLHERAPGCSTLILTNLGSPGNLRRALTAHASGFLLKDAEPAQLTQAIRTVSKGQRVIDPHLALATLEAGESPLTARETQVLQLAAKGDDVTQIAGRMFLSAGTVRNYLSNIVMKLGARNRIDAVRLAREKGWI
jgi:two-component system, NarL family, response regulator DesR